MKKTIILSFVLLIIGLLLINCAQSSSTPSSTPVSSLTTTLTTQPLPASPSSAPSKSPKYGGTLRLILWASPSGTGGLPWEIFANDFLSSFHIVEPLIHVDSKGNIIPCLAESYKVADDLKSITFNLRKNVKFHDGTSFNAQAAKWNMDNQIEAKKVQYWDSVNIIDDYTIRLNLSQWANTILTGLDGTATWMVSPTAFEKNGADWMRNNPVGTGPFKFVSFERDVIYKAVKNPEYWKKGVPYPDAVEILYVADPLTQKATLQSGEADILQVEPAKMAADLKDLGFKVEVNVTSTFCLLPDTAHPESYFSNKKVREAIEYALDREAIAKAFSYGFWDAPYQIPAPSTIPYNPEFGLARKFNVEKAKSLMAEAGYATGFKANLLVIPTGIDRNIPVAIQNQLAAIGIKLEINIPAAIPKFLEDSNTLSNVLILEPIFGSTNWNSALSFALRPGMATMNSVWLRTPEFEELYNKTLTSPTPDVKLIRAVTDYLSREAQVIPVFCGGTGYAFQSYVMDGDWNNTQAGWNPETIWLNR